MFSAYNHMTPGYDYEMQINNKIIKSLLKRSTKLMIYTNAIDQLII